LSKFGTLISKSATITFYVDHASQIQTTMSPHPPPTVPSVLLPELLGFLPQLLLDDVINVANNAVTETVVGMETFLLRWANDRADTPTGKDWDSNQDIEQGLVAFQTLLESHIKHITSPTDS